MQSLRDSFFGSASVTQSIQDSRLGPIYDILARAMSKIPDYDVVVKLSEVLVGPMERLAGGVFFKTGTRLIPWALSGIFSPTKSDMVGKMSTNSAMDFVLPGFIPGRKGVRPFFREGKMALS